MRGKTRTVRIHPKNTDLAWTDVFQVRQTWVSEGLYCVQTAVGECYRFPIDGIHLVVESPLEKEHPPTGPRV